MVGVGAGALAFTVDEQGQFLAQAAAVGEQEGGGVAINDALEFVNERFPDRIAVIRIGGGGRETDLNVIALVGARFENADGPGLIVGHPRHTGVAGMA